jgi:hypothetical protein
MTCRRIRRLRSIGSAQPLSGGMPKLKRCWVDIWREGWRASAIWKQHVYGWGVPQRKGWRTQSLISHRFGPCRLRVCFSLDESLGPLLMSKRASRIATTVMVILRAEYIQSRQHLGCLVDFRCRGMSIERWCWCH